MSFVRPTLIGVFNPIRNCESLFPLSFSSFLLLLMSPILHLDFMEKCYYCLTYPFVNVPVLYPSFELPWQGSNPSCILSACMCTPELDWRKIPTGLTLTHTHSP
jgi:hypothetical protein